MIAIHDLGIAIIIRTRYVNFLSCFSLTDEGCRMHDMIRPLMEEQGRAMSNNALSFRTTITISVSISARRRMS